MKIADIPQLRDAPLASKLELVEELWAEITAKSDSLPLPEWHVRELDRSLAEYQANPREGSPWPEVKTRILNRK
ncbi:MAG: addiction module protein [bacterium]|nr:addiction module protein [bacterium]MDI1335519.1 addiction module protein [Lacunisphaera sp.]